MRRVLVLLLLLGCTAPELPAEERPEATRIGLLRVRGDGPYRLARRDLAALGLRDPYRLELRRQGRALHSYTHEEVRVDGEYVAFVARDTATDASAVAVYELWQLPAPRAAWPVPLSLGGARPRALTTDRFHGPIAAADVSVYDPEGARPPHWYLAILPPGRAQTVPLGPMGAAPGSEQILEAQVYGTWTDLGVIEATWGGKSLARAATPNPAAQHTLRWVVPPGLVPDATAPLVLRNVSPPPSAAPARDVSDHRGTLYVDTLRLIGKGTYLVAWNDAPVVKPTRAGPPADPLKQAGSARHVILATPPLLPGAKRLAAHRTKHGLPSAAIPVTDVYDRYGHGAHHGAAIRAFVTALRGRRNVPFEYLLLAGDATYDRTDLRAGVTIPARMARTMYNGATPADGLYGGADGPEVGRLPFETAEEMHAYVARVQRYETAPPPVVERKLLRFVTSPGRFGAFIDGILESRFRRVLSKSIPPAYDVAVTYASPHSPYMWPATEFDDHVIEALNAGSLFFTYVGHGFEKGFDTLHVGAARHPILHVRDAARVKATGMSPIVFVLACTTAMYDGLKGPGIGEALLRQPDGPVAYVGATRVCHPGYNALIGESIATHMARDGAPPILGRILAESRRHALDPENRPIVRAAIRALSGAPSARLAREGAHMYALLGDPALRLPIPEPSVHLDTTQTTQDGVTSVAVHARGDFAKGAQVTLAVEYPRARKPKIPHPDVDPADPASHARIRANHAAANALGLMAGSSAAEAQGRARITFDFGPETPHEGLIVKVFVRDGDRVLYGATVLP